MRMLLIQICMLFPIAVGCNIPTGIAPTEAVIADCSERDFGFVGRWKMVSINGRSDEFDSSTMNIERGHDRFIVRRDDGQQIHQDLVAYFRTAEVAEDKPHAIVDIEVGDAERTGIRRLAIAAVKDDRLDLWMINGKAIGEILYREKVPAVIEHFTYSSTIRCSPDRLLGAIQKHSDEIIGDVRTFERVSHPVK